MKRDILEQSVLLLNFLETHPDVTTTSITIDELKQLYTDADKTVKDIKKLENELYSKRKKREKELAELNELNIRFRKLIVAIYGQDAPEVNAIGFVTKSDRKKRAKKSIEES